MDVIAGVDVVDGVNVIDGVDVTDGVNLVDGVDGVNVVDGVDVTAGGDVTGRDTTGRLDIIAGGVRTGTCCTIKFVCIHTYAYALTKVPL